MKKVLISLLLVLVLLISACGPDNLDKDNDKIQVVSSFTIITDMAEKIAGDLVQVYNLVPTGTDPHEYEPMPNDIKAATDADILFYNGLNLEGGESGWFLRMVDSVNQNLENVYDLNKGVEPKYLTGQNGREEEINPHSFLSPKAGLIMAENLRDALIEHDPDNRGIYESNANKYLDELRKIDERYSSVIASIPRDNNLLVTSEKAFQYVTETYGLREAYIWEIDTEELGTKEQIQDLIDLLIKEQPSVLFLESNVDPKPMETVSNEVGIPIYEERIYADEIGKKGEIVDTYIKLLEHNIRIIEEGLSK